MKTKEKNGMKMKMKMIEQPFMGHINKNMKGQYQQKEISIR